MAMMEKLKSVQDALLRVAVLAPSGDNTQSCVPDASEFTANGVIKLSIDESRDPSPMNAGQCMARISVGAAIENLVQLAEHNQWPYEVEVQGEVVCFRLTDHQRIETIDVPPEIADRCSNRRVYDGVPLNADTVERLKAAAQSNSELTTVWVTAPAQRKQLTEVIATTDALMLGAAPIREAFLKKVRFDLAPNAVADEGLSLGSLELNKLERGLLRVARRMPDPLLQLGGIRGTFRSTATKLACSASGFCIIAAKRISADTDYAIGRAFENAWLQATVEGLAAQPMMSVFVLKNILAHANELPDEVNKIGRQAAEKVIQAFDDMLGLPGQIHSGAMLRIGHAPPPTTRVGRLHIVSIG